MGSNARHLGAQLGLILIAAACAACPPPPPPEDPEPTPTADPDLPPPPTDGRACERACGRLRQLSCPEGEPSPKGEPCEAWFCNAVDSKIVDLDPECVARVNACSEVDGRCRQ